MISSHRPSFQVNRGTYRHLTDRVAALPADPGLTKVVVELPADQEKAIAMFTGLGFTGEALLRDHLRDADGELHDLVMLAHLVDESWAAISAVGVADDIRPSNTPTA